MAHESRIIAGLDIGSRNIRLAVGQEIMHGDEVQVNIIAAVEVPSRGISKGVISSIEDAVTSVSPCVDRAAHMIGAPIESVWVAVSGNQARSESSRGLVTVSKGDGEITQEDVERVMDAAKTVATPLNFEILHTIPRSFTVDGQTGIKNPLGMNGIRLEMDSQIIQVPTSQVNNLQRIVYRAGLEIDDLVLSVLATADSVTTKRQRELGVVIINVGGPTTSFAVYEDGDLIHSGVVPVGADKITDDIGTAFQVSVDVAEELKIREGCAVQSLVKDDIMLKLSNYGGEDEQISKRDMALVIEARAEQIFEQIDKELKSIHRSAMLPGGAIITGGGARLSGMVELAKKTLHLYAVVGCPQGVASVVDKVNDPAFSTAVGLVVWGHAADAPSKNARRGGRMTGVNGVMGKIKKMFQSLMP